MKVSAEHRAAIAAVVAPLDTAERRAAYINGDFPRAELVKDLDRRYRWDTFWQSGAIHTVLDAEYADAHLDTVLRAIIAPLEVAECVCDDVCPAIDRARRDNDVAHWCES